MPELPEVEITRMKLLPLVRGRRILDFWTDWPKGLRIVNSKTQKANSQKWVANDMRGRKILNVTRRGKVLFFRLSGRPERVMAVHLRMSGRLEVASHSPGRHPERQRRVSSSLPARWTHFAWQLSDGKELRFIDHRKFGLVWYGAPGELQRDSYLGGLGIDAKALLPVDFANALAGRRGMIKPLLLRQDVIAGIGNILADESLWHAGIHPQASVAALGAPALRRLGDSLRLTIQTVLSSGGTSIRNFRHPDGRLGRYQERRLVYGRAGESCPRCRTELCRIVVGGRGTTICPTCQRMSS